jgi:hypothetical protein
MPNFHQVITWKSTKSAQKMRNWGRSAAVHSAFQKLGFGMSSIAPVGYRFDISGAN